MKKMVLTFEWTDVGCRGVIEAEREFVVKDEDAVKKDISAWIDEMYKSDKGKHENFEVCRRFLGAGGNRRGWIVWGKKKEFHWNIKFMSWAELVMCCTMNYLGWERDIDTDTIKGKGYTFVSSNGTVKKFKNLIELDKFIIDEMGVEARMEEIG